jgi:cytochrome c oxidase subunit II
MKYVFSLTLCLLAALAGCAKKPPSERINITMKKYEFIPPEVHVKRGRRVLFVINSLDTQHGFHVDAFGINEPVKKGLPAEVEFESDKAGTFSMNCSIICGARHDDMEGRIIVE